MVMWVDSGATVVMSLRKIIDLTKQEQRLFSATRRPRVWRAFRMRSSWTMAYQNGGLSDAFATKIKELREQGEGYLDNNDRLRRAVLEVPEL